MIVKQTCFKPRNSVTPFIPFININNIFNTCFIYNAFL